MKILDKYILKKFLQNFFGAYIILTIIFIFQFIWMFIDDLAGKGLDLGIILKFLIYNIPGLTPLVLPLTVLLASILTFGTFAENYEFAAMKSTGFSLIRAMRPLIFFMIILSIVTFFINNNLIPAAELTTFNLRNNIKKAKPALAITEGAFNDLDMYNMKVDDKYGENDRFLKNVVIHKNSKDNKNYTVIKAKDGELLSSEESNILQLILKDGYYYEDIKSNNPKKRENYPFAKAYFDTYTINVDVSGFNNEDLDEVKIDNTFKMMNVTELHQAVDSIEDGYKNNMNQFGENLLKRSGFQDINTNIINKIDTTKVQDFSKINSLIALVDPVKRKQVIDIALNSTSNKINTLNGKKGDYAIRKKMLNKHIITFNNKFSLSVACMVLFFVGAPLGAIIRKGGLGLPIIISMIIFLAYHFLGMFTDNFSEDGSISPALASWIPTLVMLPIGIYFTDRASKDRPIADWYKYYSPFTRLFKKIFKALNSL
ncbi:lipopolysaccharide export system permease protein [Pustulibacterium marinum]|uniref:Lipopolysaccharide export system permease protein n=1 Tax=Pustulibacterium marinum TaxID=1224947 RepID=A0A1I7IND3_9FLAO|nr:LptF/LptG family permease [Pustulibacterium marinum]SFU74437.1 lipopolysaccharide export system permease protein [Pustulibacterium marinum]